MATATYPIRGRAVRTDDQRGIRLCVRDAIMGWVPLPSDITSPPPGHGVEACAYCLDHRMWHPVEDYYRDAEKATWVGSYCKRAMIDRAARRR